jgi:hypothetical protein
MFIAALQNPAPKSHRTITAVSRSRNLAGQYPKQWILVKSCPGFCGACFRAGGGGAKLKGKSWRIILVALKERRA